MFEFFFKYPLDVYERATLEYSGFLPSVWLDVGFLLAAALLAAQLLRRRRFTLKQRTAIWIVQSLMLAVIVWVLRQPELATEELRKGDNTLALVLDTSASMAYGVGKSRLAVAIDALSGNWTESLADTVSMSRYTIGADTTAVDTFADSAAMAEATQIGAALERVLGDARSTPMAGIVLASDGGDTAGGLSNEQLTSIVASGIPIYAIGVGRESMPEELELSEVSVSDESLPGSKLAARVSIQHDGGGETQLRVYDGDDLIASETIMLLEDSLTTSQMIELQLDAAGYHELRFDVQARDNEQELRNNIATKIVKVSDERYRVLYFEGEPRWEYKFMRRAIDSDDHVDLVSLLRVSPNKFYRQGLDNADELAAGFPTTRETLFAYDALIIGSVEAASLTSAQQRLIHDFVSERGGTLLLLAGPNGLGNGGWGESEAGAALPTRLPAFGTDSFRRIQVPVVPTPLGASTEYLRLASDDSANDDAWAALPAIADYQDAGTPKPAASTLLMIRTELGEQPLLVTQPYGRGRSFVFATGGTWRWQMSMPVEDQSHETFWRQLVRTLVANTPRGARVTAGSSEDDATIKLSAEFRDVDFSPINDIQVIASVTGADGISEEIVLNPDAGTAGAYNANFDPQSSGLFYVETIAAREGEPLATARTSFIYAAGAAEHASLRRNTALLQRLAELSGGRYMEADNVAELATLVRQSRAGITEIERRPLWDAPFVFLLLLLLKTIEWLLRRRWSSI